MSSPFDQSAYQVRFEWGTEGLSRLDPTDVVIVVDVLRFSSIVADAVAAGQDVSLADARDWSANGAAVASAAEGTGVTVLLGALRNASAVGDAVLAEQEKRGGRTSVTVIAAGERASDGGLRIAVEDQFGAGAVISALIERGIDHCSPEAVAAAESFTALRGGMRHLLSASGSGRELAAGVDVTARIEAAGIRPVTTAEAARVDAITAVPVLRDGVFVAS